MDEQVRKVTELEIRRLINGQDRKDLAVKLELCCEEGGGINTRTVRRWEIRLHKPFELFRRALCKYFDVDSVARLGLGSCLESARWWTWMTPDERIIEVDRRQLLAIASNGTVTLLLPAPDLVAAAQLLESRLHIYPGHLTTTTDVATDIATTYLATPDTIAVRAAKAHIYTLLDRLDHAQMSDSVRAQLAAIASDAACMAGAAHINNGQLDKADRWFTEALRLARHAGDRRLEALALAISAWVPLRRPDPDPSAAVEALEAAASLYRFLPPAARAYLFSYLAEQNAALGNDLVSGRFLEHAHTAIALIPHADPGWGWWSAHGQLGGWDGVRPQVFTGTRALSLGRPAEALQLYEDALAGTALPIRRTSLHKHLMSAGVALEDPDRACASAHAALDEAKAHELKIIPPEIRKVRKTFPPPWAKLRPVIELDERLALAS